MKYIIVGRAGCGRHALDQYLTEQGFRVAKSHTTRKPRKEGEDTHVFLTKEQADSIPEDQKLARTYINGEEFFYMEKDLLGANVIHCNADQLRTLCAIYKLLCDDVLHMVYLYVDDDMERKLYAARVTDKKIEDDALFNDRDMEEDPAYSELEESIAHIGQPDAGGLPEGINCVLHYYKDFNEENIQNYAKYLRFLYQKRMRIAGIIREAIALDILYEQDGKVQVADMSEELSYNLVSIDHFTDVLLSDNEGMATLMDSFIAVSDRFKDLDEVNQTTDETADTGSEPTEAP